jgi:uncharacterized protein (DUF2132 family)
MNTEINYKSNPLNGVGLKNLLIEIVDHYGFQILFAYLNINCFKNNPSIESSVKFLKKTDWAREKVEAFYLYEFKSLPKASSEQFTLPPRDRIVPNDQTPGTPAELSLEDAEQLSEERAVKAAAWDLDAGRRSGKSFNTQQNKRSNERDNIHSEKDDHELPESASRWNQQVAMMRETSIHGGIGKINRAANYVSTESGQDQLTAALHNYLGVRS